MKRSKVVSTNLASSFSSSQKKRRVQSTFVSIELIETNSMVTDLLALAPTIFHQRFAYMGVISIDAFDQWEFIFSQLDACVNIMTFFNRFYENFSLLIILLGTEL